MASELSLHLERVLSASSQLVFSMQVEPDLFAQWFGPEGFSVPSVELDVRVGGRYRITMQPPESDAFVIFGEFREIEPDARLAYPFLYDPPDPDDRDTIVVLSFADMGDTTTLTVDQGPFATEARRSLHEQGWADSLDRLEALLKRRSYDASADAS